MKCERGRAIVLYPNEGDEVDSKGILDGLGSTNEGVHDIIGAGGGIIKLLGIRLNGSFASGDTLFQSQFVVLPTPVRFQLLSH